MPTDQGPTHNVVFGDSFTEVIGKEHMKMYKVRQDSQTTFFQADCCKSLMFMDHPAYGLNETGISINTAHFKSPVFELRPEDMMCRWWTQSWDKDKDPEAYELPPFEGYGPQFKTTELRICGPKTRAICTFLHRRKLVPIKEKGDFSIQDLIKEFGEPTILNLD